MEEEVIIEKGMEDNELSSLTMEFFNAINEYNEKHEDKVNVLVLASDSEGGSSFCIGDTEAHVNELLVSATKHKAFLEILAGIMKTFHKNDNNVPV